jgi:death-on-curing protein
MISSGIKYITYDETLEVYHKMIEASDGGFEGVRDEGGIMATLDFMQNDTYYPDFTGKAHLSGLQILCRPLFQ